MVRWQALITYRHDTGPETVNLGLDELQEIQDLVEAGPHWDTIIDITIRRVGAGQPNLTVEQAAKQ